MGDTGHSKAGRKWYGSTWFSILMLIFIAPLGVFLVWKYSSWSKLWKIISSILAGLFFIFVVISIINAPPVITIDNSKNGKIETADSTIKITGTITGADANTKLTVNGKPTPINQQKYSAIVELEEGDNTIVVSAKKKENTVQESVSVHRLTATELQARKDAEAAKKKASDEAAAKKKAEADAEAASKKAAADKKSAENAAAAKAAADKKAAEEAARNAPKTSFSDGTFLVNKEIAAGTYRTTGTSFSNCYYERLSGLSGAFEDIIVNALPKGQAIVAIPASDVAFKTQGCGTWNKI